MENLFDKKTVIYGIYGPYKGRLDCSNMKFLFFLFWGPILTFPIQIRIGF
jgi:hypothetical protein